MRGKKKELVITVLYFLIPFLVMSFGMIAIARYYSYKIIHPTSPRQADYSD
jgi:hypothetical protein